MEAVPNANPMEIPPTGSVIAIYTYGRRGIFGVQKPRGILKTSVPVFSTPREFYAPVHEAANTVGGGREEDMPDLRALLDWQPLLTTDSTGHVSAGFYNADIPGNMLIVVEAISTDGRIGYQELTYPVKQGSSEPPPSHPSRTEHAE